MSYVGDNRLGAVLRRPQILLPSSDTLRRPTAQPAPALPVAPSTQNMLARARFFNRSPLKSTLPWMTIAKMQATPWTRRAAFMSRGSLPRGAATAVPVPIPAAPAPSADTYAAPATMMTTSALGPYPAGEDAASDYPDPRAGLEFLKSLGPIVLFAVGGFVLFALARGASRRK